MLPLAIHLAMRLAMHLAMQLVIACDAGLNKRGGSGVADHGINETCDSVTFYFMIKLIF